MLGFIKKFFVVVTGFIVVNPLTYVSMSNQECEIRPVIMNIYSDEPSFYPLVFL